MPFSIFSKRRIFLLAGFAAMLFMGCCYAWGIFVVPLEKEFGWLRSETSFAFTLNVLCFSGGIIATGCLAKKCGYALLLRAAALLIGAGFLLTSFASHIWQIYITYSFFCGFGIGICYNCVVSSIPQWFPEKPSVITGTLLVGYAVSTALFGPMLNKLISDAGISATFRILAAVCTAGLLLTSIWMKTPTEHEKELLPRRPIARAAEGKSLESRQMLRSAAFWLDFFMLAFISGSGMVIINHVSPLMQEQLHASPSTAALVITTIFLFNAAGRIAGGMLLDQKGLKPTLLSNAALMMAAMASTYLGIRFASILLVIGGSAAALFAFGSNANMIPCTVRELFGQANFSMNYSFMNLSTIIVSAMPTVIGAVQLSCGGYETPFLMLCVLGIADIMLAILLLKCVGKQHG